MPDKENLEQLKIEIEIFKKRITELEREKTEHLQIEQILRQNEQRLQLILEHTTNLFYVHTKENILTYLNPRTREFLDCEPEEALVKWTEFLTDNPANKKGIELTQKALETGEKQPAYELELAGKKGRKIWVEIHEAPVVRGGKAVAIVGAAVDITERKIKDKLLRQTEERFRQVAENAKEWIWEVDASGKYIYSSPVVRHILGYGPEEIIGKYFYDFFIPEERETLKKAALEVFAKKENFSELLNRNLHKNGTEIWLSTSGVPILDKQGELLGYRGADTDITESRRIMDVLRESENKYRSLFETIPDAGIVLDTNTSKIIDINEAALGLYGYTKGELVGREIVKISAEPEKTQQTCQEVIEKQIKKIDLRYHKKKDGTMFPVEISFSLSDSGGRNLTCLIIRDISERKKTEEVLRQTALEWDRTFNAILDMVFIQDKGSNIIRINKALADFLKTKPEDIFGKKCYEVFHKRNTPWPECPFQKTKEDNKPHVEEVEDAVIGVPLLITTSPMFDDKGEFAGAVHIAKDMSETRQTKKDLNRKIHDLEVFHQVAVGREMQIIELKKKIAGLEKKLTQTR